MNYNSTKHPYTLKFTTMKKYLVLSLSTTLIVLAGCQPVTEVTTPEATEDEPKVVTEKDMEEQSIVDEEGDLKRIDQSVQETSEERQSRLKALQNADISALEGIVASKNIEGCQNLELDVSKKECEVKILTEKAITNNDKSICQEATSADSVNECENNYFIAKEVPEPGEPSPMESSTNPNNEQ